MTSGGLLLIGVGNTERQDDGIGLEIAQAMRKDAAARQADVLLHAGESLALLESWAGYRAVFLIDAARPGPRPGRVRFFDVVRAPLPAGCFAVSSHSCGVPEAIEMGRALGRLPEMFTVAGIETQATGFASRITAELSSDLAEILRETRAEFAKFAELYGSKCPPTRL